MKRCPTCQKTFDDAMRFCQSDGTPLVADEAPADPYKTMVASKDDIAAALNSPAFDADKQESAAESATSSGPAAEDEPLQIPEEPIASQQRGSEFETRIAQPAGGDEGQVMEIPPLVEPTPEPPSFSEPSVSPPSFSEHTPPPSPFASSGANASGSRDDFPTTPPIPSPFGDSLPASFEPPPSEPQYSEPEPATPEYNEPEPAPRYSEPEPASSIPAFAESERSAPSPAFNPFEAQASAPSETNMAQSEWTPPAGQNQPFQSPPAGAPAGQSKTLAIISLICGIAGLTICCGTFIVSIVGLVLGFMARGKANQDPAHYGGAGLALGGIITGALGLVGGLVAWIVYVLYFAAIMSQMR